MNARIRRTPVKEIKTSNEQDPVQTNLFVQDPVLVYRTPAHVYSIQYKNSKMSKKANLVSVSIGRVQIYWPHNNLVLDGVHGLGTSTGLGLRPRHCTGPRPCTVSNVNIIGSSISSSVCSEFCLKTNASS